MNINKWLEKNALSLKGKKVAVTGSTGGLGQYVCSYVASLGGDLILLNRNQKKTEKQISELKSQFDVDVKFVQVDMVNIDSVDKMCDILKEDKIDYLILNAGAYSLPREKASTGYDQVYQINFVSPYYIVKKLLPVLRQNQGKVVVVGSIAHKYSSINENDIDFSLEKAPRKVYGNAKRFLMYSLFELLKDEKDVSFTIAHPGITPTNITANYSKFIGKISSFSMKIMFTSPKKASLNIIKAMFTSCPIYSWIGPRVSDIWGKPKLKELKTCDQNEREKIFEIAEKVYNQVNK